LDIMENYYKKEKKKKGEIEGEIGKQAVWSAG
jgi:hypothetical protein